MLQHVTDQRDPPRRRATYQDVIDAPEHMVAEIIDGELYTWPRPAPPHAVAATSLADELVSPFQKSRGGPGGWWFANEPELHLGLDVLVPDLAGWRRERLPALPTTAFFSVAPDWVCEVLSPSTARFDRTKKLDIYARERVAHVWLLDPLTRTLEVLGLDGAGWRIRTTHRANDCVRAAPFDAIEIRLTDLWGDREDDSAPQ